LDEARVVVAAEGDDGGLATGRGVIFGLGFFLGFDVGLAVGFVVVLFVGGARMDLTGGFGWRGLGEGAWGATCVAED
jgi:hypothetical protein